jgi:hypothetical protein
MAPDQTTGADMVSESASVANNPAQQRYELASGDRLLGIARYRPDGAEVLNFVHTEIEPSAEGQGYGSRLVQGALDDVRSSGKRVIASCRFVAAYIDEHPEYRDLLVDGA